MNSLRGLALVAACCAGSLLAPANAYEVQTHEDLTGAAVDRSVLTTSGALTDLGLKGVRDEAQQFPNSTGAPRTILNLFRDGARFEDSVFPTVRPLRHFYNPITGQGLNVPVLPTQTASPDWALARRGTDANQERSYWDARKSFFDALTKPLEAERQAAFGETFQFLGQVLHHLQDMAQPQHVRNDAHCDWWPCSDLVGSGRSRYELWTNRDIVRSNLPMSPPFGYNITGSSFTSTFSSPRRFWHTEIGLNSWDAGKGMAEFTNRNFVSHGTNFGTSGLFPGPIPESLTPDVDVQGLCQNAVPQCSLQGKMTFYGNTVRDKFLGMAADTENPRASTLSLFDQDLIMRGGTPKFSLNRFNFQAAHSFLIPRAVAYSAGMINYFFRGKIDLVPDDTNPGTYVIKNLSNEDMSGTFTLYYDDAGNNRKQFEGMSWNLTIPANDKRNIGAIPPDPTNPAPKNPGEYMLVFKGDMGAETTADFGAIVGKVVTIRDVIDLGPGFAFAINNRGDVVGEALTVGGPGMHAVLWSGGSVMPLGALPGEQNGIAFGINNNVQIVGGSQTAMGAPNVERAFLWTSSAGMQDLGFLSSTYIESRASGINDSGLVVGSAVDGVGFRAFLWSGTSGMQSLGLLPGSNEGAPGVNPQAFNSGATAINNPGQVVGYSTTNCRFNGTTGFTECDLHAFLWSSTTGMLSLGTLGFGGPSCAGSLALAISGNGQIAGSACTADGSTSAAVRWSSAGAIQDLGRYPGARVTYAAGINDQGQVVGFAEVPGAIGFYRAFSWSNGVMTLLSDLPEFQAAGFASVVVARGINNAGQVAGYGIFRDGSMHAFILTPRRRSP